MNNHRLSRLRNAAFGALAACFFATVSQAGQVTVNFEGFTEPAPLTNQVTGLLFSRAAVINAGGTLNELEFPPVSGIGVATDDGGPIGVTINLAQLGAVSVTGFSAFFTYTTELTIEAFDASNNRIKSAKSLTVANYVSSGNSANELIAFSSPGITRLIFSGDAGGGSFVMDDLTITFDPVVVSGVPEPGTWMQLLSGLAAIVLAVRGLRQGPEVF